MSVVPTSSLTDITVKCSLKSSKKMLQPKFVSFLYRLANEMSSLQTSINWLKLLKSEPVEPNRLAPQAADLLLDGLFTTRDRRSSR